MECNRISLRDKIRFSVLENLETKKNLEISVDDIVEAGLFSQKRAFFQALIQLRQITGVRDPLIPPPPGERGQ